MMIGINEKDGDVQEFTQNQLESENPQLFKSIKSIGFKNMPAWVDGYFVRVWGHESKLTFKAVK